MYDITGITDTLIQRNTDILLMLILKIWHANVKFYETVSYQKSETLNKNPRKYAYTYKSNHYLQFPDKMQGDKSAMHHCR